VVCATPCIATQRTITSAGTAARMQRGRLIIMLYQSRAFSSIYRTAQQHRVVVFRPKMRQYWNAPINTVLGGPNRGRFAAWVRRRLPPAGEARQFRNVR
jgi:hypothetical protein